MKNKGLAFFTGSALGAALVLISSCMAPGPALLPTEGPLERQVNRVVERHDIYVKADDVLTDVVKADYLSESNGARILFLGEAKLPADVIELWLGPVMDRHDEYVLNDTSLDVLQSDSYLASTAGIRSLLETALKN